MIQNFLILRKYTGHENNAFQKITLCFVGCNLAKSNFNFSKNEEGRGCIWSFHSLPFVWQLTRSFSINLGSKIKPVKMDDSDTSSRVRPGPWTSTPKRTEKAFLRREGQTFSRRYRGAPAATETQAKRKDTGGLNSTR